MNSIPSPWQSLLEPYRRGDWHECIDLLRPHVDAEPDELGSRLLLAALYLRAENRGLAQVHVEHVLPLAVGQRDLFRALGAQRLLDQLNSTASAHSKRYLAIHRWFSALGRVTGGAGSREAAGEPARAALSSAALLRLAPRDFHRVAEACRIEDLVLEPRDLACDPDEARVVLYGRVRWSVIPDGDGPFVELTAEAGGVIAPGTGAPASARLRLAPELPSACLTFDLETLRALTPGAGPDAASTRPARPAGAVKPATRAAPGARRVERPVPDPVAEPMLAVNAPIERRRGTRVTVAFESRVALLGVAGNRVAPFGGRLVDLSPAGMGVGFPPGELRHLRDALEGALITIELKLPGRGAPLGLTARVRWVSFEPQGVSGGDGLARLGLEFVLLSARARARIREVLIHAARQGRTLGAAPTTSTAPGGASASGKALDGGKRAA